MMFICGIATNSIKISHNTSLHSRLNPSLTKNGVSKKSTSSPTWINISSMKKKGSSIKIFHINNLTSGIMRPRVYSLLFPSLMTMLWRMIQAILKTSASFYGGRKKETIQIIMRLTNYLTVSHLEKQLSTTGIWQLAKEILPLAFL